MNWRKKLWVFIVFPNTMSKTPCWSQLTRSDAAILFVDLARKWRTTRVKNMVEEIEVKILLLVKLLKRWHLEFWKQMVQLRNSSSKQSQNSRLGKIQYKFDRRQLTVNKLVGVSEIIKKRFVKLSSQSAICFRQSSFPALFNYFGMFI
jgi:hypothetical protein